jgi:hypothetical protein
MATDSRKRPGRGFASTARAAAITRFIRKHFDVKTLTPADSLALYGVRVSQESYSDCVRVRVSLPDEGEAVKWAEDITGKLVEHGYEIQSSSGAAFYVTKQEWKFDDMVSKGMFAVRPEVMESDAGLVTATPLVVEQLRGNGWLKPDTLELTELGQRVRERLLVQKRTRGQAERRRLRERGW